LKYLTLLYGYSQLLLKGEVQSLIMLIGHTGTQSPHLMHFSPFMVMAPPRTSIASSLQILIHGASDGLQCIQNKMGVSTLGIC